MKQIIFNNKKIFYKAEGNGKPVMLLHGFAEDNNIWNYQFKKLKDTYYVIVPDLPGSGQSELLEGTASIADYADVIKAIADAALINKSPGTFTLIGHSMGGYIALAFAKKYPGLLNGLVLFHSTAYEDDLQKKESRKKGIEFIKKNGVFSFLKTATPNLFSEKTKKQKPWLIENMIERFTYFLPAVLMQYYQAMMERPDSITLLKSFNKPILFIIGKYDNAVPMLASLQQCYIPSVSSIKILKNSGHMGMVEQKSETNKILHQFLETL